MKVHYIVKNGERQTDEMSVFEAVEVLKNFKALSNENDRLEIHSFCKKWDTCSVRRETHAENSGVLVNRTQIILGSSSVAMCTDSNGRENEESDRPVSRML